MNSNRPPEKEQKEEKTVNIDVLKCIRENDVFKLKLLVESNLLTYDMPVNNGTVLSYAKETVGVSRDTLEIFKEQQKTVETILQQSEVVLKKIISAPETISNEEFNLYKNSKLIRERLASLVATNTQALLTVQNKKSVLSKILFDPALQQENPKDILALKTLKDSVLFDKIMNLQFDYNFLQLLASKHDAARHARTKLFDWMWTDVNAGKFHSAARMQHDHFIEIFKFIYQHDEKEKEQRLTAGIRNAKRVGIKHDKIIMQAETIFHALLDNKVTKDEMKIYSNNIELLTIFKNKIIETKDLRQKIDLYDQLFNFTESDPRQLDQLFYFYEKESWFPYSAQSELLFELELDLSKTNQQHQREQEQSAAFEAAVAKLKKRAESRSRYVGRYRDTIPLTELPPKEQRLGLFKPKPTAYDFSIEETPQSPYVASIKPLNLVKNQLIEETNNTKKTYHSSI